MIRARLLAHVSDEYREPDGYWIELLPGWRMPSGEHAIVESTKGAARARLIEVEPCDCAECVALEDE